jgi:hypothetical protein
MMQRIKAYTRKHKEMREQHFFYQGQNQGFLSAVVLPNRCKPRVNGRSKSDKRQYVNYIRDIWLYWLSKIRVNQRYLKDIILKHFKNHKFSYSTLLLNRGVR